MAEGWIVTVVTLVSALAIIGFAIYSRGFRRTVLIAIGLAVAGGALLFYNSATKEYRDCVALMWDRKHPAQVRQRYLEHAARKCDKDRLSSAASACDPERVMELCEDKAAGESRHFNWEECISHESGSTSLTPYPNSYVDEPWKNPCDDLALEELRRADAEANRDKPPR